MKASIAIRGRLARCPLGNRRRLEAAAPSRWVVHARTTLAMALDTKASRAANSVGSYKLLLASKDPPQSRTEFRRSGHW